ncbi:hypothetical protein ACKKBF_B33955 [Auxenochlorella protothecoides x Auxenochlorella symbiontica]
MPGPVDIQGLPVEVLARVFSGLPTDALQAVELVCRLWRSIVREADVWLAHPSLQPYPTLAEAARRLMLGRLVVEHPRSDADPLVHLPVGDRETRSVHDPGPLPMQQARLWVHKRLVALVSCLGPDPASSLARNVLGASTTDHREESAINLLLPEERVTFGLGLSYWSSRGSPDPGSRDWVALRLAHPLVLVQEIRLRPFQAWFQPGGPVYAPVGVRFRIGGPMLFHPGSWQLGEAVLPQVPGVVAMDGAGRGAGAPWPGGLAAGGLGPDGDGGAAGVAMPGGGGILADAGTPTGGGTPAGHAAAVPSLDAGRAAAAAPERGGWDPATLTWVSAVFPVQPGVAEVQAFRLPRPVLCVGGCVTVELLGKTQRQEEDGLLYVCLSYVHVVGRPLYGFAMDPWRREGGVALEALAVDPLTAQGGLQTMEKRLHAAVAMWHVHADRGAWLVPGEGWEAFRRGAD